MDDLRAGDHGLAVTVGRLLVLVAELDELNTFDVGHDLFAPFIGFRVPEIVFQLFNTLLDRSFRPAKLPEDTVHFFFNARDLLQADLMDLIRRKIGAGEAFQKISVSLPTILVSP